MTEPALDMAQDLVAPDRPPLNLGSLALLLLAFPGLGDVQAVDWHSHRPFAASGIVRCGNMRVFVKRHDPRVRNVQDLVEEHAFIAHLKAHGAAAPEILVSHAGETALAGQDGTYEIHALSKGEDIFRDAPSWTPARNLPEARAAGQALAHLHAASDGFLAPARRTRLVVASDLAIRSPDLNAAVVSWANGHPMLGAALHRVDWQEDFRRIILPWHQAVSPHWAFMPPAWAHGDFHVSNLLWHKGHVSAVLDFGLSNRASAMFDLATAIERNAIEWLCLGQDRDIGRSSLACALIEAYAKARGLADTELAALRHLLPIVHVDFALSELAYFHGITFSRHNASLAYTDFLLGHAAWFAGKNGTRFLSALA